MKKLFPYYIVVCALAFCSIIYELILAQSLSAFLADTVMRYSVTIGLYMSSMGVGVWILNKRPVKDPLDFLIKIECILAFIGGLCVFWICFLDFLNLSRFLFQFLSHALIIGIGILTGFELPLLLNILGQKKKDSQNIVLGMNYLGAFLGSVVFAFVFYRHIGLIGAALCVGIINICAAIGLPVLERARNRYLFYQCILLAGFIYGLLKLPLVTEYITAVYLG